MRQQSCSREKEGGTCAFPFLTGLRFRRPCLNLEGYGGTGTLVSSVMWSQPLSAQFELWLLYVLSVTRALSRVKVLDWAQPALFKGPSPAVG